MRLATLALVFIGICVLLWSGAWDQLSFLKDYAREGQTHILLAFGSLIATCIVGIPLGIACYRSKRLRTIALNILNAVQTISSIALFGLLIAPLGALAAEMPALATIGVSGIGVAPAMLALLLYSLLPVVANTVVGLLGVPEDANDAAMGMGHDRWSAPRRGATAPGLSGHTNRHSHRSGREYRYRHHCRAHWRGCFGVFVFQGIGQTAMDLVLLGALPTIGLAFASAVILDAFVEMTSPPEPAND